MGKKSKKSASKSKNKTITKEELINEIEPDNCSVCHDAIKDNYKHSLTCMSCKKIVHKICYAPTHQGKNFNCDQCLSKKKDNKCFICKEDHELGPLKITTSNVYHIDCVLFSPHNQFESFSTYKVVNKKQNTKIHSVPCKICNIKDTNTYLSCQLCNYTAHYKCIWLLKLASNQCSFISNWLDKCQSQNYLLEYITKQKKTILKQYIKFFPKKLSTQKLIICDNHQNPKNFCWCPCNRPELNPSDVNDWIMCDQCDRYSHRVCTGLGNKSNGDYLCKGCVGPERDIFSREMKIHQTIQQLQNVEKSTSFSLKNIRFLNAFPFNYSQAIENKIQDHLKQIEQYFALREIEQYLQRTDDQMDIELSESDEETVMLLVLFILNGQRREVNKRKLANPEQIKKILDDIEVTKKITTLQKENILKVRSIFQQLLQKVSDRDKYALLKEKLTRLIFVCSSNIANRSSADIGQISELLYETSEILQKIKTEIGHKNQKSEDNFLQVFQQKFKNTFIWTLIDAKKSKSQMKKIVQRYGISQYLLSKKNDIEQQEYQKFKKVYFKNPQKKQNKNHNQKNQFSKTQRFLRETFNKIKVKSTAVAKHQKVMKMNLTFQRKQNITLLEYERLQEEAITSGIATFGTDLGFQNYQTTDMERNLVKKIYLLTCSKEEQQITQEDFQLIPKLDEFLKINANYLNASEKHKIKTFRTKLNLFHQLLKKGKYLLQNNIMQSDQDESDEVVQIVANQKLNSQPFQKFISILERWNDTVLPFSFMIPQIFDLIKSDIHFTNALIEAAVENLVQKMGNLFQKMKKQGRKIPGVILRDFIPILKFYEREEKFEGLNKDFLSYQHWINITPSKEPISKILERPQKNQNLLRTIDNLLSQVDNFPVDISNESKKLKVVRLWCLVSEKIYNSKKKPTINAIQNIKTYSDKLEYPKNSLWVEINNLASEGIEMNKQISKFLQKPKYPEFMEIYDELQIINLKMNYSQGIQMKQQFEKSNLDIGAEIQELEQQLKQYQNIPINFQSCINTFSIIQLRKLRNKCFDSSFKPQNMEEYYKLVMKICEFRCQNFEPPITKPEYYQLINLGGVSSIQFMRKTSGLNEAYKIIERAQHQIVNVSIDKRNFNFLISWDDKKIRQIKQELKIDPMALLTFERARQSSSKLRDTYSRFRIYQLEKNKIEFNKIVQLQNELQMTIFNHKELINQIRILKIDYNQMVKKLSDFFSYSKQKQVISSDIHNKNFIVFQKNILQKYRKVNIKNQQLDNFERNSKLHRELRELSVGLLNSSSTNIRNYHRFNLLFKEMNQNFAKIPEVLLIRQRVFFAIFKRSMGSDPQLIDIWNTLIDQGLELKRLKSGYADKIFNHIFQLYAKIKENKVQREQNSQNMNGSEKDLEQLHRPLHSRDLSSFGSSQDDDDHDDDDNNNDDDDDDQDDDMLEGELDDYDFDSQSESSESKGNVKKNHNQIVLDDD